MGCSIRCWLATQLHWLWHCSGLAICILDLGFDSKLTTQASSDRCAHSFGSLNVWNTFVHIWDDLVFVALGERVKIFDLPSVYRVYPCVCVPIQILRLLIHAIEQYVVKQLPPLNPTETRSWCYANYAQIVQFPGTIHPHPGDSIELASFFCTTHNIW